MGPRVRQLLVLVVLGVAALGAAGAWTLRDLPDVDTLAGWRPAENARLLARDGTLLGQIGAGRQTHVPLAAIAPDVRRAFVVAEDGRFWTHGGIDARGVLRALVANLRAGRTVQGGSTLTQQVARLLLLDDRERSGRRKLREAALARRLEARFGKEELLELYLNAVYLGEGCTGVEAAAWGYFGHGAAELPLAEAALLATLPPRPGLGSPRVDPEGARRRRDRLLARMAEAGVVTPDAAAAAQAEPLQLAPEAPPPAEGAYARHASRLLVEAHGLERLRERGGLRATLAVDPALQAHAERVIAAHAAALSARSPGEPPVHGAFFAMDTVTGDVLALVAGGADPGEFDRATQARRPVGSTFKPVVYLAGIDSRRLTAADVFEDGPLEVALPGGGTWSPENYGGVHVGSLRVAEALASSNNRVLVRALLRLDPGMAEDRVYGFARRLGLGGPPGLGPEAEAAQTLCPRDAAGVRRCGYALGLGAADLTLQELVRAYSVFATGGLLLHPRVVVELRDAAGRPVPLRGAAAAPEPQRVIEQPVAAIGNWLLREVVRHGTAARARDFPVPVAGKTGTSDEAHDVWFVGMTPSVVAGVWFGADTPRPLGAGATGGSVALPAWLEVMAQAPRGRVRFPPAPAGSLEWTGGAEGEGVPLLPGTTPSAPPGEARPWYLGELPALGALD